jgi:hypothetical protein
MNTANLQLEGLCLAIAALTQQLVSRGLIDRQSVDQALATAEATAIGDDRSQEDLSPANRDAVVFPIRLLRLANRLSESNGIPAFSELAKMVGQTKPHHNDQL